MSVGWVSTPYRFVHGVHGVHHAERLISAKQIESARCDMEAVLKESILRALAKAAHPEGAPLTQDDIEWVTGDLYLTDIGETIRIPDVPDGVY